MKMSIRMEMALAALMAVALLAAAFAASAQAGEYKQASFKAEIKGVQTYASEHSDPSTGPCDMGTSSSTQEKILFKSKKPVLLTATKIPGLEGLSLTGGAKGLRFPTTAKVTRSHSSSYTPLPEECGGNGGGVTPREPDCGTRVVKPWWLTVDYYKPDHVELQPEDNAGSDLYEMCGSGSWPYLLSGETFGKRQSAELPEDEVFDSKIGKLITIGKGNRSIVFPGGEEETNVRWELSLTRIKDKR